MIRLGVQLMIDARLGELVVSVESSRAVEVVEDVHDAATVPVVCHTATVVDVTGRVLQHLEEGKGLIDINNGILVVYICEHVL